MKIINQGKYIELNTGYDEISTDCDFKDNKIVINIVVVSYGQLSCRVGDIVASCEIAVDKNNEFECVENESRTILEEAFLNDVINFDDIEVSLKNKFGW